MAVFETLDCSECWGSWRRPVKRGRKPSVCPTCRAYYTPNPVCKPRAQCAVLSLTDGGRKDSGFGGEGNDCTVRALATATGRSYEEAFAFLSANGRKRGRGVRFQTVLERNGNRALGCDLVHTYVRKSRGLKTVLERNPQLRTGTWILHMTRHVATLRDGRLLDSFDSSRKDIDAAWRVLERSA